jgi:hypothetical protein
MPYVPLSTDSGIRTACTLPNVRFDTVVEPEKKEPRAPRLAEMAMKPPLKASDT